MNNFNQLYQDSIKYQQLKKEKKGYLKRIDWLIDGQMDTLSKTRLSRAELLSKIDAVKKRIK